MLGALVEAGGNPQLAIEAIADRLPETMTRAQQFVDACQQAAEQAPRDAAEPSEGYGGDPVADFGDVVREQYADEANAFYASIRWGWGQLP